MRSSRLTAHYGFGAARLALPVAQHIPVSSAAGLGTALRELGSGRGLLALLRSGALGAGALALLIALAPAIDRSREREIVWLRPPAELIAEIAALPPQAVEEIPPPQPLAPEAAPPAVPEPVAMRPPAPAPPPLEPPAPEPVVRAPVRPRIAPEPLRVAALATERAPETPAAPRAPAPRSLRAHARLALPPAPAAAPAPAPPEAASRTAAAGAPARVTRARPPALEPPRFAQAAAEPAASVAPGARGLRAAPAPAPPASPGAAPPARLRGVSLAALAACLSDREEDALRQRVVAAVPRPEQCTSEAGTWRFVETKNVNAFLLWVERTPSRRAGDRCEELTLALDCLARGVRRELHEG